VFHMSELYSREKVCKACQSEEEYFV